MDLGAEDVVVAKSPRRTSQSNRGPRKRFQCNYGGCGRSYSRAEHLQRHRLNHVPKEVFVCPLEWCATSFVRKDLFLRHQLRHEQTDTDVVPPCVSDESNASPDACMQEPSNSSLGHGVPNGQSQPQPPAQSSGMAGIVSFDPTSPAGAMGRSYGTGFTPSFNPIDPSSLGVQQLHSRPTPGQGMPGVAPEDHIIGLSPSSTAEFVTWLFDGQTPATYHPTFSDLTTSADYSQINLQGFPTEYPESLGAFAGQLCSPLNLQTQFASNPVDPADPSASAGKQLSREKWQQLIAFITEKLIDAADEVRTGIMYSDFDDPAQPFSGSSVQSYLDAYWKHFHGYVPILHEPTFFTSTSHTPLLLAVMILGMSMLQRQPGYQGPGHQVGARIAWHLRGHVMMHADASPPGRLWVFQTLVLLEAHDKLFTTRALHERSLVYFPTTLNLMRRSSTLFGRQVSRSFKTAMDKSFNKKPAEVGPEMSVGFFAAREPSTPPPEIWWEQWIVQEAVRRVAFAAFIIDTTHAVMFGHTQTLVFHEIHLFLPCDGILWASRSPAEVGAVESALYANGVMGISFLDGLRRILNNQPCRTDTLGWLVLLSGLLSIIGHMQQRDLLISTLQYDPASAVSPERWQPRLIKALDWWRKDYENHLRHLRGTKLSWQKYALSSDSRHGMGKDIALNLVTYHMGHMNISVTMPELGVYAGANVILGRPVSPFERRMVHDKIAKWSDSPDAAHAVYHALQLVKLVMFGGEPKSAMEDQEVTPTYDAVHETLPDRSWALYFATMVLFAHGFQKDGPLKPWPGHLEYPSDYMPSTSAGPSSPKRRTEQTDETAGHNIDNEQNSSSKPPSPSDAVRSARAKELQRYLAQMLPASVTSAQEMEDHLKSLAGRRNELVGLLSEVNLALAGSKWELLDEARRRLDHAALLLKGGVVRGEGPTGTTRRSGPKVA